MAIPAVAAPGGGECTLDGSANFDGNGLTLTSASFTYNFAGSLSSCNSNNNAPTAGTVKAGTAYQVTVPYTINGISYSATYALPEPTGSGSCAQSTTSGFAVATWSDATNTVISYTTTGAVAEIALQGTVVPSVQTVLLSFTGPTAPSTPPPDVSSGSDFASGDGALGQLVFSTSTPQSCQTGLSSATISGVVGLGATGLPMRGADPTNGQPLRDGL
jgi:hypothetical protein